MGEENRPGTSFFLVSTYELKEVEKEMGVELGGLMA